MTSPSVREIDVVLRDITPFSMVVRELSNGVWFILALNLFAIFVWYSASWIRRGTWPWDIPTQAAIALGLYFAGASIRAGLLWLQWVSINHGWELDFWQGAYFEIMVAITACIAGGALAIRVFTPPYTSRWLQIWMISTALGLPFIVHYAL